MSALEQTPEPRPVRVIVREFIADVVEGEDEINQQELVDYAIRRFAGDDEFIRAPARAVLPVLVPEVLGAYMRGRKESVVSTPTGYITRKKLDRMGAHGRTP